MKSPTPEAQCAKGVFQIQSPIQSPICGVYFSNNISIPQVRVNKGKLNLIQPLKPFNH